MPVKKLKTLNNLKGKLQGKIQTYKKQHEFFVENDTCPTCSQPITEEIKKTQSGEIVGSTKELVLAVEELRCNIEDEEEREKKYVEKSSNLNKIQTQIAGHNSTITRIQKNVKQLLADVETLQNSKSNDHEEV